MNAESLSYSSSYSYKFVWYCSLYQLADCIVFSKLIMGSQVPNMSKPQSLVTLKDFPVINCFSYYTVVTFGNVCNYFNFIKDNCCFVFNMCSIKGVFWLFPSSFIICECLFSNLHVYPKPILYTNSPAFSKVQSFTAT